MRGRVVYPRFFSSSSSSSNKSDSSATSTDPTTREIQRSEAKAQANAALTQPRAEGDVVAAGVTSGAPPELFRRPVRIYQPSQESTQR